MEAVELSAAEIETLREAVDGCGGPSYTQAIAILDRLSPPTPEVDEATRIWREIHVHEELAMGARGQINTRFRNGDYDNDKFGQGGITYLRTALSELIASKDAEIEKWRSYLDTEIGRHRKTLDVLSVLRAGTTTYRDANLELQDELENSQEVIAALRAENERLQITLDDAGIDVDQWVKCERAAGNIPSPKAAERNTAEPASASADPRFISRTRAPASGSSDALADRVGTSADNITSINPDDTPELPEDFFERAEIRIGDTVIREALGTFTKKPADIAEPATDTAPVVEVTVDSGMDAEAVEQAELLWAQLPVIRKWTSIPTHEKALVCHLLSTYRTEAEARGRREALENIDWLRIASEAREADSAYEAADKFKRLMTEGK